jgi:methylated-DNA-[protein]-cysteine S-methyltransferase
MTPTYYTQLDSPVGTLLLTLENEHLTNICMFNQKRTITVQTDWVESGRHFRTIARQLEEYFRGKRRAFEIPMSPQGTDFQMSVWQELLKIPYGETATYGDIAKRIGNPKAVRAVGLANGRNPLPIVIPCHRVIGANGQLTGFGGGLENKALLLKIEESV